MLARVRLATLVAAMALTGCPYSAPVLTNPVVLKPEDAANLVVLVRPAKETSARITTAMNSIAAELRGARLRVTMDPKAAHTVDLVVFYGDPCFHVSVFANRIEADTFGGCNETGNWENWEIADFARHVRQRLERSAVLAELASRSPTPGDDQGRAWVKTASASSVKRRLAVLEFHGSVAPPILVLLTDQARAAAVEAVRPSGVAVMTRENMMVMLKDQGRSGAACTEGECEVDTARLVGADLVITGEVSRVGDAQFLVMKLFETASGSLLASKQADATEDLALVKAAKPAAAALFE